VPEGIISILAPILIFDYIIVSIAEAMERKLRKGVEHTIRIASN